MEPCHELLPGSSRPTFPVEDDVTVLHTTSYNISYLPIPSLTGVVIEYVSITRKVTVHDDVDVPQGKT